MRIEPWLTNDDLRRFKWIREAEVVLPAVPSAQRTSLRTPISASCVLNGDQPLKSSPYQEDGCHRATPPHPQQAPGRRRHPHSESAAGSRPDPHAPGRRTAVDGPALGGSRDEPAAGRARVGRRRTPHGARAMTAPAVLRAGGGRRGLSLRTRADATPSRFAVDVDPDVAVAVAVAGGVPTAVTPVTTRAEMAFVGAMALIVTAFSTSLHVPGVVRPVRRAPGARHPRRNRTVRPRSPSPRSVRVGGECIPRMGSAECVSQRQPSRLAARSAQRARARCSSSARLDRRVGDRPIASPQPADAVSSSCCSAHSSSRASSRSST